MSAFDSTTFASARAALLAHVPDSAVRILLLGRGIHGEEQRLAAGGAEVTLLDTDDLPTAEQQEGIDSPHEAARQEAVTLQTTALQTAAQQAPAHQRPADPTPAHPHAAVPSEQQQQQHDQEQQGIRSPGMAANGIPRIGSSVGGNSTGSTGRGAVTVIRGSLDALAHLVHQRPGGGNNSNSIISSSRPPAPQTFDCIVVADLLKLGPSPAQTLLRCARHLARDGRLIFDYRNTRHLRVLRDLIFRGAVGYTAGILDPAPLPIVSLKMARAWCDVAGLDIALFEYRARSAQDGLLKAPGGWRRLLGEWTADRVVVVTRKQRTPSHPLWPRPQS